MGKRKRARAMELNRLAGAAALDHALAVQVGQELVLDLDGHLLIARVKARHMHRKLPEGPMEIMWTVSIEPS